MCDFSREPFPGNLCKRRGADTLVHLIKFLLDECPDKVVVSIDGVGAFDHICRSKIFTESFFSQYNPQEINNHQQLTLTMEN